MIILGIETSCDETALSLIEVNGHERPSFNVLAHVVNSQIKIHEQYGGVFPMMAKREHGKNLIPLLRELFEKRVEKENAKNANKRIFNEKDILEIQTILLKETELSKQFVATLATSLFLKKPNIDALAVTFGPGLEPALWVGINFAKALSYIWNIPIIPVNHMEGHIVASLLKEESIEEVSQEKSLGEKERQGELKTVIFPALSLLISGGHTELVLMKKWREYEIIGQTKDDAVGEAFDKVARILGLPYPGGPEISRLAEQAELEIPELRSGIKLPRPMIHSDDFNFSFSGLKTAVLYAVKKIESGAERLTPEMKKIIAKEFQDAVVEVLLAKTKKATEEFGIRSLIVGGGVIANKEIREALSRLAKEMNMDIFLPPTHLSTDNAVMIALAGYFSFSGEKNAEIKAQGNLRLT